MRRRDDEEEAAEEGEGWRREPKEKKEGGLTTLMMKNDEDGGVGERLFCSFVSSVCSSIHLSVCLVCLSGQSVRCSIPPLFFPWQRLPPRPAFYFLPSASACAPTSISVSPSAYTRSFAFLCFFRRYPFRSCSSRFPPRTWLSIST